MAPASLTPWRPGRFRQGQATCRGQNQKDPRLHVDEINFVEIHDKVTAARDHGPDHYSKRKWEDIDGQGALSPACHVHQQRVLCRVLTLDDPSVLKPTSRLCTDHFDNTGGVDPRSSPCRGVRCWVQRTDAALTDHRHSSVPLASSFTAQKSVRPAFIPAQSVLVYPARATEPSNPLATPAKVALSSTPPWETRA